MTAVSAARSAILARGLTKRYGKHVVLDGIDLEIGEGSVFALLGPNGAGKTTAVHILTTLLRPDSGAVTIGGFDVVREPARVRGVIGLTGQVSAVDPQFTGVENLGLMADLHHLGSRIGRTRVRELLERFDLVDAAEKPVQTWSGGMRRRLDLAMTLVGSPRVLFLDEPTTGLDPRSRRVMWDIVRELVADGVTVFLTTQYLEEADRLATRIAMLDNGRIVAEGTPAELKRLVPGGSVRLEFESQAGLERAIAVLSAGDPDEAALALELPHAGGVPALRDALGRLDAADVPVAALAVRPADLDDVFLSLTGRRDGGEEASL